MSENELVSVADAARSLNRSTEQVRRYLREGRLAGKRIGGQWFIEAAAVNTFINTLRAQHGLEAMLAAPGHDVLYGLVGIGRGGGSSLLEGKDAYRRAFWFR